MASKDIEKAMAALDEGVTFVMAIKRPGADKPELVIHEGALTDPVADIKEIFAFLTGLELVPLTEAHPSLRSKLRKFHSRPSNH